MKPAAFLFDLDGTLLDTEALWTEAIVEWLADRGAKVTGSVSGATGLLVVGANPGADKTAAAARFGTPKMDEAALREALGLPPAVEQMALF